MAKKLAFDLIESKHKNSPFLRGKTLEVELEIQGDPDPLTIQQIYDHLMPDFKRSRSGLNSLVVQLETELKRHPKKRKEIIAKFARSSDKRVRRMTEQMQESATAFGEQLAARAEELEAAKDAQATGVLQFLVRSTWSGVKLGRDALEVAAELWATSGAGLADPSVLRKLHDMAVDLKALFVDYSNQVATAATVRDNLLKELKKIKRMNRAGELTKRDAEKASKLVKLYGDKLDQVEAEQRNTVKRFDAFMKLAKRSDLSDETQTLIARCNAGVLKEISDISSALKKNRKKHKEVALQVALATKAAKRDRVWSVAGFYDMYDKLKKLEDLIWDPQTAQIDEIVDGLAGD
jgi:hypothetical protein